MKEDAVATTTTTTKKKKTSSLITLSLHCLTVNGIPLFSKQVGHTSTIPFPVVGSLNGVHMFSKSKGLEMGCTRTENGVLYWKEFESLKFVLVFMEVGLFF